MTNKSIEPSIGPLVFKYNSTDRCLKPDRETYHKKIGPNNQSLKFKIEFDNNDPLVILEILLIETETLRNFSDFFQNLGVARTIKLSYDIPSIELNFKPQLLVGGKTPLHEKENELHLTFLHNIPTCGGADPHSLGLTHVDLHVEC